MSSARHHTVWHPFTGMPTIPDMVEGKASGKHTTMVSGQGCWVEDQSGRRYLNLLNAANTVGLGREEIIEAIDAQYRQLTFHPLFGQSHEPAEELAHALVGKAPPGMQMVFYANDGSGAMETALKLSRYYFMVAGQPQRRKWVSMDGSYHGTSYGASAVSNMGLDPLFAPGVPGNVVVPAPNLYRPPVVGTPGEIASWCADRAEQAIVRAGPETVAAIVMEPIQGLNGCVVFPSEYGALLRQIADKYGVMLIADEVGTGMGRTGAWFASATFAPDLIAVSKGLTSGYFPLGATLVRDHVYNMCAEMSFPHGWTCGGHPVACRAALAVLSLLEREQLVDRAARVGEDLLDRLRAVFADNPYVGDVRGAGMMLGIEFVQDKGSKAKPGVELAGAIVRSFREAGLLAAYFEGVVTMYPPLTIAQWELEELLARAEMVTRQTRTV